MCVQLICLGDSQALVDKRVVRRFRSEKVRALLFYLGVENQKAHPRHALASLFWPNYEDRAARNSLRVSLYRLRSTLEKSPAKTPRALFRASRQSVQADSKSNQWSVDVLQFQHHVTTVVQHQHASLVACEMCQVHLTQAANLYKGEFLAEFPAGLAQPFDEWVARMRHMLQQQALFVFESLLTISVAQEAYHQTILYGRQLLDIAPWHEVAHRFLMAAHATIGQRSVALAQFDLCCQVLEEEFNASPSDETFELYQQIKKGISEVTLPASLYHPYWIWLA